MTSDELETTSRSTSSHTLTVSRRIQAFHGATEKVTVQAPGKPDHLDRLGMRLKDDRQDARKRDLPLLLEALQRRIAELEVALAAKDARSRELEPLVAALITQIAALTRQVAELTEKLGQNSRNSHLPPSSDPPGSAGDPGTNPRAKSGRKRGGQRGHRGARRELVPEAQVNEFVELYPAECESCWTALPEVADANAKRYQLVEVPPLLPHTTEWRRHAVTCACCGHKTRAGYDEAEIPASPFGPRLMGMIALLTGVYHVSRRKTAKLLSDLVGVPISLGAISAVEARVSDAVKPAVDEAWTRVEGARARVSARRRRSTGRVHRGRMRLRLAVSAVGAAAPGDLGAVLRIGCRGRRRSSPGTMAV